MNEKVIFITGASSGIGAQLARRAAVAGYRLVLAARRIDRLEQLAAECGAPQRAIAIQCDVANWGDQQEAVGRALDAFGRIDAAVANAGIYRSGGGFADGMPEHWKQMVLTNVYGAALTARAALAALKKTNGHLVLVGSAAGRRPIPGSMYGVTKWAVTGMARNLREELRDSEVRVTIIEPGVTNTELFSSPRPDAMDADDVAKTILFAIEQHPRVDMHEILMYPSASTP